MSETQRQLAFWDWTDDRSLTSLPPKPTADEIAVSLARNNKSCPLNRILVSPENEGNFRILHRFASAAYRRFNRSCRGFSFGIYCPPGQGKTFVVKQWAATIGIPLVFVQSSGLKDTSDLFEQIKKAFEVAGTPIVPCTETGADYKLPPCIVFMDEAHEIKPELQRGGLLNPMEPDDGMMHVREAGDKIAVVDCKDVCWIAATTDPADLFDAFRSRFLTSIEWVPAGPKELALIVKAGLDDKVKRGDMSSSPPMEACEIIAKYQSVPRSAIHGFGVLAVLQKEAMPSQSWDEACLQVASDLQIDRWGMTKKQVMILTALGQRPVAKSRLGDICKCRSAQVETMELPGLSQYTNGGPFCLSITGRGVCITEAGLRELDKRGIPHNGRKVTAEFFESKR